MRVAIIGSRSITKINMDMLIACIPSNCSEIVSGGAAGMDTHARTAAELTGTVLREFLPDYAVFGKIAPLMRNLEIIRYSDLVLAFWDGKSRGTQNVIQECIKQKVPVKLYKIKPNERESANTFL